MHEQTTPHTSIMVFHHGASASKKNVTPSNIQESWTVVTDSVVVNNLFSKTQRFSLQ